MANQFGGSECTPSMPTALFRCCRYWPIVLGYPIGRCGICGTVPVPVPIEEEEAYYGNDL